MVLLWLRTEFMYFPVVNTMWFYGSVLCTRSDTLECELKSEFPYAWRKQFKPSHQTFRHCGFKYLHGIGMKLPQRNMKKCCKDNDPMSNRQWQGFIDLPHLIVRCLSHIKPESRPQMALSCQPRESLRANCCHACLGPDYNNSWQMNSSLCLPMV